jgi:hypothetical protein
MLSMQEWDEEIRPHLMAIEDGAAKVISHATQLRLKPPFETRAEHALQRAETVLATALARVQHARAIYQAKRIDE